MLTETQAARQAVAEARRQRRSSPAGQDLLQRSEHARLLARLESMPAIEQAKGIIMASHTAATRTHSTGCAGRPSAATYRYGN